MLSLMEPAVDHLWVQRFPKTLSSNAESEISREAFDQSNFAEFGATGVKVSSAEFGATGREVSSAEFPGLCAQAFSDETRESSVPPQDQD